MKNIGLFLITWFMALGPALAGSSVVVTPQELAVAVADHEKMVPEFNAIREEAERAGLRAWLFGGTASGYIHYVKWDLLRKKGDARYQGDRFDYDFSNIYRSTQDLDIVIDGDEAQKIKFEAVLGARFPFFLGAKTKWEVRSLKVSSGSPGMPTYKEALLNSFDFLNQNTDSNSTGMIELTRTQGESVVRDLREWTKAEDNSFLVDSAAGRNTFYHSVTHKETSRAKLGQNPEIFAVIRALTKAFQYELTFSEEDQKSMQAIIDAFTPADIQGQAAIRRLQDMGKKLFKHAVNLEYAWNTVESMGLRKKLMVFDDVNEVGSLAWWMNKEPLRSAGLYEGPGRTAKEMDLDVVAHEASDFLAYESITRAHTGDPNVLISRQNTAGEAAIFGNGFYTKRGRAGARGTGFTIRFHLDPLAKENRDFAYIPQQDYVVILNKSALKVIPESLNMTLLEYLKYIVETTPASRDQDATGRTQDKGLLEKLSRRMKSQIANMTAAQLHETVSYAEVTFPTLTDYQKEFFVKGWLDTSLSVKYPHIVQELLKSPDGRRQLVAYGFSRPAWMESLSFIKDVLKQDRNARFYFSLYALPQAQWSKDSGILKQMLEILLNTRDSTEGASVNYSATVTNVTNILADLDPKDYSRFVEYIIKNAKGEYKGQALEELSSRLLNKEPWRSQKRLVKKLISAAKGTSSENSVRVNLGLREVETGHPALRSTTMGILGAYTSNYFKGLGMAISYTVRVTCDALLGRK